MNATVNGLFYTQAPVFQIPVAGFGKTVALSQIVDTFCSALQPDTFATVGDRGIYLAKCAFSGRPVFGLRGQYESIQSYGSSEIDRMSLVSAMVEFDPENEAGEACSRLGDGLLIFFSDSAHGFCPEDVIALGLYALQDHDLFSQFRYVLITPSGPPGPQDALLCGEQKASGELFEGLLQQVKRHPRHAHRILCVLIEEMIRTNHTKDSDGQAAHDPAAAALADLVAAKPELENYFLKALKEICRRNCRQSTYYFAEVACAREEYVKGFIAILSRWMEEKDQIWGTRDAFATIVERWPEHKSEIMTILESRVSSRNEVAAVALSNIVKNESDEVIERFVSSLITAIDEWDTAKAGGTAGDDDVISDFGFALVDIAVSKPEYSRRIAKAIIGAMAAHSRIIWALSQWLAKKPDALSLMDPADADAAIEPLCKYRNSMDTLVKVAEASPQYAEKIITLALIPYATTDGGRRGWYPLHHLAMSSRGLFTEGHKAMLRAHLAKKRPKARGAIEMILKGLEEGHY